MLFTVVKGEHEIRARVLKKDGKRRGEGGEGGGTNGPFCLMYRDEWKSILIELIISYPREERYTVADSETR